MSYKILIITGFINTCICSGVTYYAYPPVNKQYKFKKVSNTCPLSKLYKYLLTNEPNKLVSGLGWEAGD